MDAVKIGQFLCALRKERRWTQQEAAARLGVTDKSISKWETARGLPDITVLPAPGGGYGAVLCPDAPPLARAGSVPADLAESVSLLVPGPAGDAGAVWNLSCAVSYFQKNQKRNLNRMSVLHPAAIAMKAAAGFFAAE